MSDLSAFLETLLSWLSRNLRLLGVLAIMISAFTWWLDLSGLVYECVYCRTQRTAIGIVGLILLLPDPRQWFIRFVALAVCFLGADIAVDQQFLVIKNINSGKPFGLLNMIMSAGALFTLVGLALLLFTPKPGAPKPAAKAKAKAKPRARAKKA